jgi:nicotinamide mononucleotide transporter
MVGCNMRVQPLGWPLAIVSSLLYAALFLHYRLYGKPACNWSSWRWRAGAGGSGCMAVAAMASA